jgi:hypothetical protein
MFEIAFPDDQMILDAEDQEDRYAERVKYFFAYRHNPLAMGWQGEIQKYIRSDIARLRYVRKHIARVKAGEVPAVGHFPLYRYDGSEVVR